MGAEMWSRGCDTPNSVAVGPRQLTLVDTISAPDPFIHLHWISKSLAQTTRPTEVDALYAVQLIMHDATIRHRHPHPSQLTKRKWPTTRAEHQTPSSHGLARASYRVWLAGFIVRRQHRMASVTSTRTRGSRRLPTLWEQSDSPRCSHPCIANDSALS